MSRLLRYSSEDSL